MSTFIEYLQSQGACQEGIDWVGEKCKGAIVGLGVAGYQLAVECLCDDYLKNSK
jgi:3-dehydroquinate dehydratase